MPQGALPSLPRGKGATRGAPVAIPLRSQTANWLNMVVIEIGLLRSQCLDRRIPTQERVVSEIAAWERQRNASGARTKWMITTAKPRIKWGVPTSSPSPLPSANPAPKSHNHCAGVLGRI
jgi:hypothetical protein